MAIMIASHEYDNGYSNPMYDVHKRGCALYNAKQGSKICSEKEDNTINLTEIKTQL